MKMTKKIWSALVLIVTFIVITLSAIGPSTAGDVKVLLYYSPGGTYDRINQQVIAPALGDKFDSTVAIKGCAKMSNYFRNTDEKVFALWDLENNIPQDNGEQNPCYMDNKHVIGIAFSLPFHVCHVKGLEGKGMDDFRNNKDIRIGMVGLAGYRDISDDILSDINPHAKQIPYSSSRKYLPALQSGEVDYLFSIQKRDNMTCIASTDNSSDPSMVPLNTMSDSVFADKAMYPVFVYKNMSKREAQKIYNAIINSDEYTNVIEKKYVRARQMDLSYSKQMRFLKKWQDDIIEIMKK
jgi:hypothetical protein